tara:strand:+ start:4433 stop:4930 length:498 start_codon:yes stop_codon:yes gene_type:complete
MTNGQFNTKYISNALKKLREYNKNSIHILPTNSTSNCNIYLEKRNLSGIIIFVNNKNIPESDIDLKQCYNKIINIFNILHIPIKYCNIFYYKDTTITAFNIKNSIFFNIAYFNLNENEYSFNLRWIITICHELAHNEERGHTKKFIYIYERILHEYLTHLKSNFV